MHTLTFFNVGLLLTTGGGYLPLFKSKLALNPRPDPDNNQCLTKSETPKDVSVWTVVKCTKWLLTRGTIFHRVCRRHRLYTWFG